MIPNEARQQLAELFQQGSVVIFSGAGMSTESGLKDFRSQDGLWHDADPMLLVSHDALMHRYEEFWQFYQKALIVPPEVQPNVGHKILAQLEEQGLILGIITQNIDRLHQRAGSRVVAELHGSNEPITCCRCRREYPLSVFLQHEKCECGGNLRPNVVLFGEMLPQLAFEQAEQLAQKARTFVVLGSSLVVSPANHFPLVAKQHGAKLVIINREATMYDDYADLVFHQSISEVLMAVVEHKS